MMCVKGDSWWHSIIGQNSAGTNNLKIRVWPGSKW